MKYALTLLTLALVPSAVPAQNITPLPQTPSSTIPYQHPEDNRPFRTFTLQAGSSANDANEVLTAIRVLMDPDVKVYLTPAANTISVRATPTQLQLIEKIIAETNQPRKAYRLTYTITEMEAGKRIGVQNFAVVVAAGGRTTLKDGSKIPIATGTYGTDTKNTQTQFTYLDIGLNIDASVDEFSNGARLRSKIEQSSAAEEKTIAGVTEPIIRQSVLEGTAFLTPGKPVTLGAFDIPGSTRHLEVAVTMDPIH